MEHKPSDQAVAEARSLLDRGLAEIGLPATGEQRAALIELARLVERWGARINLIGRRGLREIVRSLLLDAAALSAQLPEIESLADLGSGAGFPGIPIAVLRSDCRVTLVESRLKRHHFQRAAIRALELPNATPILGRAEDLESAPHSAAVAQAVARPDVALALLVPWVAPGGLAILPGGATAPDATHARVRLERVVRYRVPCGGPERTLWLGRVA